MKTSSKIIPACLLLFACNNNNNKEGNVNDTINDTIVERLNNPLAGKKFYYLEKDKTNSYDNHMILKACLWTSKRFIQKIKSYTLLGKEYKKSYELLKTDYSPQNLGVFLTEAEYNKYKHLWEEK